MALMNGWEDHHPALANLFRSDNRLLQPDHPFGALFDEDSVRKVPYIDSIRILTEKSAQTVLKHNEDWIRSKAKLLSKEEDLANAAAILAEIRSYGSLLAVWDPKSIECLPSGQDFAIQGSDYKMAVEVHARQRRSEDKKTHRSVTIEDKGFRMSVEEEAPFGLPPRDKKRIDKGDNVQGECVSKIADVKAREHQFVEGSVNVLWLDFADARENLFYFSGYETSPVFAIENRFSCGCLWNSFYANRGDPIFTRLDTRGPSRKPYYLEFPGRFNRGTKIDLVVVELGYFKAALQNHLSKQELTDDFFQSLFRLEGFSFQHSWVDWPIRGELPRRIELSRAEIEGLVKYFL